MDILERQKVTSAFASTFHAHQIVLSERTFPNLKSIRIGGAVITKELIKKARNVFTNARIIGAYGSTEADSLTTAEFLDDKLDSSGKPVVNVEFKVKRKI